MASRRVVLRAAYDRVRPRVERRSRAAIQRFWRAFNPIVIARLERAGRFAQIEELVHPGELRYGFNGAMLPQWKNGLYVGWEFETKWIGRTEGKKQFAGSLAELMGLTEPRRFGMIRQEIEPASGAATALLDMPPATERAVTAYLVNRQNSIWRQIWRSYTGRLKQTLAAGLEDGDSTRDLTKRVQVALGGYARAGAERVARTEATGAMNFGGHRARIDADVEFKEWLSTIDRRTRPGYSIKGRGKRGRFDHRRPNGQIQRNGSAFLVSGQLLMYPGDTSLGASAGNVIACRCTSVAYFGE